MYFCNRCVHLVESGRSLPITIRKSSCEQGLDIAIAIFQRRSDDRLSTFGSCNSWQAGQNRHCTCLSPYVVLQKVFHDKAPETTKGKRSTVVDDVLKEIGSVEFVSVLDDAFRHSAPVPCTQQNCKMSHGKLLISLANESDAGTRGNTCGRNKARDP